MIAALLVAVDCRSVDHDVVEFAVIVAVEQADAAAHGFDDVVFFGRRNVGGSQSGLRGDVAEDWNGCGFSRSGFGGGLDWTTGILGHHLRLRHQYADSN